MIDKDGSASRTLSGLYVPPSIAHHHALRKIQVPSCRPGLEQPRKRLSARALVVVIVRTDKDVIQRETPLHEIVHLLDLGWVDQATRNVRLIRYHDEHIAGATKVLAGVLYAGQDLQLCHGTRRVRNASVARMHG